MTDNVFKNISLAAGKLLYIDDRSSLQLVRGFFKSISAASPRGLIEINSKSIAKFIDCSFDTMSSEGDGGLLNAQTQNNIQIEKCTFSKIKCTVGDGGVFYLLQGNSFDMLRSSIQDMASGDDGAFMQIEFDNKILIQLCNFTNGVSTDKGGVLKTAINNVLNISQSNFKSNYAIH